MDIARREIDVVWNDGELDRAEEFVAEDVVIHDPASMEEIRGIDAYRDFVSTYRDAFPDLDLRVEDLFAGGDRVCLRFIGRGTHEGELLGVEATGNETETHGITIHRFEDERIAESWANYDALGMLTQLGAVPSPEQRPQGGT